MAEMQVEDKGKKGKKPKQKKHGTRVDLTPMVDLGFLLITFFMLTTSMLKPQTMEIGVPSKDDVKEEEQNKVKASQAITVLLGKENKLYYYFGTEENGVTPELIETDYSSEGIRKMLMTKNYDVMKEVEQLKKDKADKKVSQEDYTKRLADLRASKGAPVIMIKAADEANYKNLVDILDEMQICNIGRYAIVDITPDDLAMIDKKTGGAK
ncbi:MAG TPA: biopolymer transporter ExbD [Prolixibacteraceae bacterium]|jgi:biopolymer transport protein ExbD|nr:biopolymer transporter ExbD [Prolixibacteraceae bacterium]